MTPEPVLFAFALTTIAGLCTGLGSATALLVRRVKARVLASSLGFSAGVMVYVSFAELLKDAGIHLSGALGKPWGNWAAAISFFAGIFLIALIDRLVPAFENPHEVLHVESMEKTAGLSGREKLAKVGFLVAVAMSLHNIPEGVATFVSGLQGASAGVPMALGIGIHNMVEGMTVSMPILFATGNRGKAFWYSFMTGLIEPAAAVLSFVLFRGFPGNAVFGIALAATAGIMVFVSFDELFPAAQEFGEHHAAVYGLIAGMAMAASSLLFFQ